MNWVNFQDTELIHRFLLHSYPLKMKNLNKIKVAFLFTITSKRKRKKKKHLGNPYLMRQKINTQKTMRYFVWNQRWYRWRKIMCLWIGRINAVKITLLPRAIYSFNAISIKWPMTFFSELEQNCFTVCIETQKTPNIQISLKREKWSWRNQASWLQTMLQS